MGRPPPTFSCSRPFARYVRETSRQNCRIVNFSSTSGLFGNFGQTNYGAASTGIAGFTRVLALEMMKYECTVNTIAPAAATRLTLDLVRGQGRNVDANELDRAMPKLVETCKKHDAEVDRHAIARTLQRLRRGSP